ncbi:MAG: homoserine O-acetyltransferase [Bacteroidales bacterium]|nr:homoserine O-acetyltransferase [Bacteroidales bacterium]
MTQHEYIHEGTFDFEAGGSIEGLKIVYHCSEKPWQADDTRKVIWICHALTANSDAEDWWPELTGPGKLFDTEKYFVICANMLGSAYGSSGPASVNPQTGKPYFFDFPRITVRDIVRANDLVRRHLGIGTIDLMIGGSIGGFQSLEWSIMEPEVLKKAVYIACGARVTPWLTAYNESMRLALEADPSFRKCEDLKGGEAGLRCARSIALISYRSYEGYNSTQREEDEDCMFADRAGSYQRYQGKKLADRFDAYSYYYLCGSVDSNNVGRGRGGVEAALSTIKAECTVIGIDSDRLFPVEEQKLIAAAIPGAVYHEITSKFGHDGFLLENEQLTLIIKPLLP